MLPNDKTSKDQIKSRLRQIEEAFERELRARGFDPRQVENLALSGDLAKLYAEREELQRMIDELTLLDGE